MRLRRRQGDAPAGAFGGTEEEPRLQLPVPKLTGWLLAERGYGRVELRVGEREPIRARLFSLAQPQIAELAQDPSAPMSGWIAIPDLGDLDPEASVEVTATALGPAGELELGSARFRTAARPPDGPADPGWLRALAERAGSAAASHRPGSGLRLLAFTHNLALGGGQLYLMELVNHLLEDPGTSCTVVAPEDGPLRERLERAGAAVHLAARPGHGDAYECHQRELVALAGEVGANAIFANTALAFDGIDLGERLGIPTVWAIHESQTFDQLLYGAGFLWTDDYVAGKLHAALDSADAILFEADATRRIFAPRAADPSRLAHLDYGIELAELDRSRRALDPDRLRAARDIRPEDRVIFCPGTIEPRKAQLCLALVFARLAAEFPDATLTLVGKGDAHDDYMAGTEEVIGRLGLPPGRIRIEPITPHVHEWFMAADAAVVASDNESLPRVILEAMAFGLPVLGTRVFGIPELIEDGANGLLCEPQDLDSLEQGLRRLLMLAPEEARELGAAAKATVRPERDAARYAATVRALFERLLAEPRDPSAATRG